MLHKVRASVGTGTSKSSTRFYYTSKIRFMKRFYPARFALTLLIILMQAVKSLLTGGRGHALVILKVVARSGQIAAPATQRHPVRSA